MRISAHQIHVLMLVLYDSLNISHGVFGMDRDARLKLYNEILQQQDNTIRETNM